MQKPPSGASPTLHRPILRTRIRHRPVLHHLPNIFEHLTDAVCAGETHDREPK